MNEKRIATMRVAKGYHILPVRSGMQLELHEHVGEGNNKRIWKFKGLVIKVKKPNHADGTFTIRGKSAGHTIEKIYPLSFPNFDKVVLLDEFKIRRAKLYYIRDKVGKDAKMKSLLTNAEKGVDLLVLAKEDIDALQAVYNESNASPELESVEDDTVTVDADTTPDENTEAVEDSTPTESVDKDESSKENN